MGEPIAELDLQIVVVFPLAVLSKDLSNHVRIQLGNVLLT